MHIHIHNDLDGIDKPISQAAWDAAGIPGQHVTFGSTAAAFNAQAPTLEILIAPPWKLRQLDLFTAPHLKMLQTTSAGLDMLSPFTSIPPGVLIVNNRGTHAAKGGEYCLMAILMLVNLIPRFVTDQHAGTWDRQICGLAARQRLTIVGLGALGSAAAQQAKKLGMPITGLRHTPGPHPHCDRTAPPSGLDDILPETDILLLACPLTDETRGLLSRERLAKLPPGAGIINIGRGKLIDQEALFDALDAGHIGGAVLDVFTKEPIPAADRAWHTKNLIITPHMSADDPATYNSLTLEIFKENLNAYMAGNRPPTLVDRQKGY
jgi:phosphoglycerate dehydrogenase-like enzyme